MITSYQTRSSGIIVLVYSQIGFLPPIFISTILQSGQKSIQLPVTRRDHLIITSLDELNEI